MDVVLQLLHDTPSAGQPGRDRTLALARSQYYWPTMHIDVEKNISQCLSCAQTKCTTSTAPILEYPLPAGSFDVFGIDLLQLPRSTQGSVYILVCVDHFSRFVVLAPLRNKSSVTVAHAIVSHLICPYTTPRVLLSDNGTEFKNQILADICSQYNIKQTFIIAHHPASNGLVERTNRNILEISRHLTGHLHDQSINEEHTPGNALHHSPDASSQGGPSGLAPMRPSFLPQAILDMIDRLSPATSYVGVPLVSSNQGCPLQREPCVPDRRLGGVPLARIAGFGVHGLCC